MEQVQKDEAKLIIRTAPQVPPRNQTAGGNERAFSLDNSYGASGFESNKREALYAPINLPLGAYAPKLDGLDLALCPKVLEDGWYNIDIEIPSVPVDLIESARLYVNGGLLGEISFESNSKDFKGRLVFNNSANGRGSLSGQPFLLLFEAVVLSIVFEFKDDSSYELYSSFLLCLTRNKTDMENVSQIIKELSEFDDYRITKWLFDSNEQDGKKNFIESQLDHFAYRSISSYIKLLEEISLCYLSNFPYFRSMGKHRLKKKGVLVTFQHVKTINEQSFNWLMQNAEQLKEVPSGGLSYQNKNYLPLKIHSQVNHKSYDIYENQVVVGFLYTVLNHAQIIFGEFENKVSDQENKLNQSNESLPDNYSAPVLAGSKVYVDYCRKDLLAKLDDVIKNMMSIYRQYLSLFTISIRPLNSLPRKSKIFQEIRPYTHVFAMIIKWFEFGNYSLDKDKLLLRVQTLDKLFEVYCLIALIKLLSEHGYEINVDEVSSVFHYDYNINDGLYQDESTLPNTFIMYKGNCKVTLYYQPIISAERFYNELKLFRTTSTLRGNDYYTPDYVLKFEDGNGQENYIIFDAKFSSYNSIMNNHLQDVIRKYSQEMAVANEVQAPKMVWILQGRSANINNSIWRVGNSKLAQQYEQATSFGIFALTPLNTSQDGLWNIISQAVPWA